MRSSTLTAQGPTRHHQQPSFASLSLISLCMVLLGSSVAGCGASSQGRVPATPTATAYSTATPFSTATVYPTATLATSPTSFPVAPFAPSGEPVTANGIVYVTTNNGYLYALNAGNGSLIWRYHADAFAGPPTLANGVIYFGAADGASQQSPSYVYAVNAGSGTLLWRASVDRPAGKPIVANGAVYVGTGEYYIYAFRASDGVLLWQYISGGCFTLPLASDGTYLYVNTVACAGVLALHLGNGVLAWRAGVGGGGAPAVANGIVYVSRCALRASDGGSLGCFQTDSDIVGTDAVVNGTVYIATDKSLYAWNTTSGAQIWKTSIQHHQEIFGVGSGAVYTGATDGQDAYVRAYQVGNGALLWSALVYPIIPLFDGLPTSLGATLYMGTTDGAVVAVRAADGAIMWRAALQ